MAIKIPAPEGQIPGKQASGAEIMSRPLMWWLIRLFSSSSPTRTAQPANRRQQPSQWLGQACEAGCVGPSHLELPIGELVCRCVSR